MPNGSGRSRGVVYLDASALVKLVWREPETDALRAAVRGQPRRVSSALSVVEVSRSIQRLDVGNRAAETVGKVLAGVALIRMHGEILLEAARAQPASLRSLDAIHLATAQALQSQLSALITYDRRLADAAEGLGLPVLAPC